MIISNLHISSVAAMLCFFYAMVCFFSSEFYYFPVNGILEEYVKIFSNFSEYVMLFILSLWVNTIQFHLVPWFYVYLEFIGSHPCLLVSQYFLRNLHIPLVEVMTHEHIQNTKFAYPIHRLNHTIIRVKFYKSRQTQMISIFIFK